MKFKCNSSILLKGINHVLKAVSNRSPLPVMENIYMELGNKQLCLRGNDLEVGIESLIPIDSSDQSGAVLVKASTLNSIVTKMTDSNQSLSVEVDASNKVIIQSDQVDFDILGTAVDEYPTFPKLESGIDFTLTVSELRYLIRYTLFSVSTDETKQFLNGILFQRDGNQITLVSTDGFRLSVINKPYNQGGNDCSVIVPYKAMNELNKVLQLTEDDQQIQISVSENQVSFKLNDFLLISRLIQGQFPDYRQVLPKQSENVFKISRKALVLASERATIISSYSSHVVRLNFVQDKMTIRANAAKMGEFKEELVVTRQAGEQNVRISFNVKLLLDALKNMDSDDITLAFNNELSPCVVQQANDDHFTYIIMPIRTSEYDSKDTE